ncbi:MAG: hypothetical protein WD509_01980 [Candidatus Paceibacterota bacterium]
MDQVKSNTLLNGAIKIGQEDHINELHKEGHLFCNTLKYFREIEKKDFNRHDDREGAFKTEVVENPEDYKLSIDGKKAPVTLTFLRFNEFDSAKEYYKLFCLFGVKRKHVTGKPFLYEKILKFGEKALIILDLQEFIDRIKKRLNELELEFKCAHVKYYEENGINEKLTAFHKPDKFQYQEEFRILIKEDSKTPFSFKIGSIEDISTVIDANKLTDLTLNKES